MLTRFHPRGFTLVELLVTITIIGVMVAVATPSFVGMLANGRIGSATKSYAVGLQTARTEAIRTNVPVQFVLTDTPIAANIENTATESGSGQNWLVRYVDPAASGSFKLVEAKSANDGSGQTTRSPIIVAPASAASFTGIVTFNGFGAADQVLSLNISSSNGICAAAGGPLRCQTIQIRGGGQIATCDPAAAPGDSRACLP